MLEIMTILNSCIKKEIVLYSTKEGYVFQNDMNSKVLGFAFGLMAEIERNLISMRTKEALAQARGGKIGTKERNLSCYEGTSREQKTFDKRCSTRCFLFGAGSPDGSIPNYYASFPEV